MNSGPRFKKIAKVLLLHIMLIFSGVLHASELATTTPSARLSSPSQDLKTTGDEISAETIEAITSLPFSPESLKKAIELKNRSEKIEPALEEYIIEHYWETGEKKLATKFARILAMTHESGKAHEILCEDAIEKKNLEQAKFHYQKASPRLLNKPFLFARMLQLEYGIPIFLGVVLPFWAILMVGLIAFLYVKSRKTKKQKHSMPEPGKQDEIEKSQQVLKNTTQQTYQEPEIVTENITPNLAKKSENPATISEFYEDSENVEAGLGETSKETETVFENQDTTVAKTAEIPENSTDQSGLKNSFNPDEIETENQTNIFDQTRVLPLTKVLSFNDKLEHHKLVPDKCLKESDFIIFQIKDFYESADDNFNRLFFNKSAACDIITGEFCEINEDKFVKETNETAIEKKFINNRENNQNDIEVIEPEQDSLPAPIDQQITDKPVMKVESENLHISVSENADKDVNQTPAKEAATDYEIRQQDTNSNDFLNVNPLAVPEYDFEKSFQNSDNLLLLLNFAAKVESALKNLDSNVIGVTSSSHLHNRTCFTYLLGRAFADKGLKTLLLDADFARPRLNLFTDNPCMFGLKHLLSKDSSDREIYVATEQKNLFILPSGTPDELQQEKMDEKFWCQNLIKFKGQFPLVILVLPSLKQLQNLKLHNEKMLILSLLDAENEASINEYFYSKIMLKQFNMKNFRTVKIIQP
jgi:Mrp family chromosome partitioning ATPase